VYENKKLPPLPRPHFLRRLLLHFLAAVALVLASLGIGMVGYAWFEQLEWRDSFLNAAMLLGGMARGPRTRAASLRRLYALCASLVFLVAIGIVLAPIVHRVMHRFLGRASRVALPAGEPPRRRCSAGSTASAAGPWQRLQQVVFTWLVVSAAAGPDWRAQMSDARCSCSCSSGLVAAV
jgi:hypothetical protein